MQDCTVFTERSRLFPVIFVPFRFYSLACAHRASWVLGITCASRDYPEFVALRKKGELTVVEKLTCYYLISQLFFFSQHKSSRFAKEKLNERQWCFKCAEYTINQGLEWWFERESLKRKRQEWRFPGDRYFLAHWLLLTHCVPFKTPSSQLFCCIYPFIEISRVTEVPTVSFSFRSAFQFCETFEQRSRLRSSDMICILSILTIYFTQFPDRQWWALTFCYSQRYRYEPLNNFCS